MSTDNIQAFRDRVMQLLSYDPETGTFNWKTHKCVGKVGKVAGWVANTGYVAIDIDRKKYLAHRLAWLIMTGDNPAADIDHVDNNKVNNAFSNLREANRSQNLCNRTIGSRNTSGYLGVSWHPKRSKWLAQIRKDKVNHYVGYFSDPKDAAIARDKAAIRLHGEYSRLNFKYVIDEEGNIELDE